ncbi:MAG: hypothetical protein AAB049_05130 [Nitrospirota bacterium]
MSTTMRSKSLLVRFAVGALVIGPCLLVPQAAFPEDQGEPRNPSVLIPHETIVDEKDKDKELPMIPMLHCGKCPEGFVKTAVAAPRSGLSIGADFDMSEMCKGMYKSEETTVVECKPIGKQNQMPVCGTCPEGYLEIGRSLLPALCGNEDGGLRTQCQLPKMEGGMPDPTQGGRKCPPDCVGNLPIPGQGNLPPHPPKFPSVEIQKERPEGSP